MALFKTGALVATPAALKLLQEHNIAPIQLLSRHIGGDWGDLDEDDVKANVNAIQHNMRILSSYKVAQEKVWIITESDRSATTILLPEDY